jgi:YD repeat-containing protein
MMRVFPAELFIMRLKGTDKQRCQENGKGAGTRRSRSLMIQGYDFNAAITTSSAYDPDGNLTLSVDGDGNSTSYAYDAAGNQTEIVTAAGTQQAATTVLLYDGDGNLTQQNVASRRRRPH